MKEEMRRQGRRKKRGKKVLLNRPEVREQDG